MSIDVILCENLEVIRSESKPSGVYRIQVLKDKEEDFRWKQQWFPDSERFVPLSRSKRRKNNL